MFRKDILSPSSLYQTDQHNSADEKKKKFRGAFMCTTLLCTMPFVTDNIDHWYISCCKRYKRRVLRYNSWLYVALGINGGFLVAAFGMEGWVLNNFEHIKWLRYTVRVLEIVLILATFVCMVIGTLIIIFNEDCEESKRYAEFPEGYKMTEALLIFWYICFGVFATIILCAFVCVRFKRKKPDYS